MSRHLPLPFPATTETPRDTGDVSKAALAILRRKPTLASNVGGHFSRVAARPGNKRSTPHLGSAGRTRAAHFAKALLHCALTRGGSHCPRLRLRLWHGTSIDRTGKRVRQRLEQWRRGKDPRRGHINSRTSTHYTLATASPASSARGLSTDKGPGPQYSRQQAHGPRPPTFLPQPATCF